MSESTNVDHAKATCVTLKKKKSRKERKEAAQQRNAEKQLLKELNRPKLFIQSEKKERQEERPNGQSSEETELEQDPFVAAMTEGDDDDTPTDKSTPHYADELEAQLDDTRSKGSSRRSQERHVSSEQFFQLCKELKISGAGKSALAELSMPEFLLKYIVITDSSENSIQLKVKCPRNKKPGDTSESTLRQCQ